MSSILQQIKQAASASLQELFQIEVPAETIVIQETKKEFEGHFTLVVFPLSRYRLGKPEEVGAKLGAHLVESMEELCDFNVIKGFLNLSLHPSWWVQFLADLQADPAYFRNDIGQGKTVVVEFCSPNTNKPLHLGHLRNIILGSSVTNILQANGYRAIPTCLFNDRGSAICKSMYTWQQAGKGDTPASTGIKGDKLVGKYYVEFGKQLKAEVQALVETGVAEKEAEKQAAINQANQALLLKWEAGDPEVRELWKQMNGWVYEAFEGTFARLGVSFEQYYYESEVYLRGKETVEEGLKKGVFFEDENGSVVVDNTDVKLDKKVLLRSNGTSLYITQDLAIAEDKFTQYEMEKSIYVVGDEQEYHFKTLFAILKKLEKPYAKGLYHLSYGMVNLRDGRMKSAEGTTVEADDMMDEVKELAKGETLTKGKTEGMSEAELDQLYENLGQGALKYYLVKVDPRKGMLYVPDESVELQGHTGPFIQYSYTRTAALKRKYAEEDLPAFSPDLPLEEPVNEYELAVLLDLFRYPAILQEAADSYNPALIANFAYDLAKDFNRLYQEHKILQSDKPHTTAFRFALAESTGQAIKEALHLIGIQVPERM